jgi:hypothetical protein
LARTTRVPGGGGGEDHNLLKFKKKNFLPKNNMKYINLELYKIKKNLNTVKKYVKITLI